jgi:hypothetical protein
MTTTADPGRAPEQLELSPDSPAPAVIYLVAGTGLAICLVSLLLSRGNFSLGTVALALLATLPFLLFARLAMARPGAEAVVAGVLLLAVGTWGSVVAMDTSTTSDFVRLPLSLVGVQLAVFGVGAALRLFVPPRRTPID